MKKIAGSTTTVYLGKDFDVEGTTATKYIFLGDQRVSSKTSTGSFFFYHTDYISSSNVITDSSGNQTALYEYDPYGTTVTHTGATEVKHRFTGQEADDSTGLYYYGARYMDPQLGRFITSDPTVQHPTDPQDLNRYAYARNNPIRFTDPTGLGWFSKILAVVGAAIGFALGGPIGAIIGGAIGGALGAMADAAIANQKLGKAAIQGAIQGAITGAAYAAGAEAGGGGSSAGGDLPSSAKIVIDTGGVEQSSALADTGATASIANAGISSKAEIILYNAIGNGVAWAAEAPTQKESGYKFSIRTVRAFTQGKTGVTYTGHAWIALTKPNGVTINYGFRNAEPLNYLFEAKGTVDNLDGERYSKYIEKTWSISEMQYQQVVDFAKAASSKTYSGTSFNCTDFVLDAAGKAGINIPRNEIQRFGVTDPNKLADYAEEK